MLTPVVTPVEYLTLDPECGPGSVLIEAQDVPLDSREYDELHLSVGQYA